MSRRSSSTLISNVAWWAGIDPFGLNRLVSDGSGYDIACARSGSPLFYKLSASVYETEKIRFLPAFHEHLAFIYLGRKQDTFSEIKRFVPDLKSLAPQIDTISEISSRIAETGSLGTFNNLIDQHEDIISGLINREMVKDLLFPDFNGSIKSLGAWGGDFILASSPGNYLATISYFKEKGYPVAFAWKEIIR